MVKLHTLHGVQSSRNSHPANASIGRHSSALAEARAGATLVEGESVTGAPFILSEALAASRILTISSPRRPSVSG